MPSKRKYKYQFKKNHVSKKKFSKFIFLLLVLFVLVPVYKLITRTKYWSDDNRLVMVTHKNSGEVIVSSIDPVAKEIVNISIPGTLIVEVAGNLGRWKLGRVWDLGSQDNKSGKLLASTLTSYLGFPVSVWSDEKGIGLIGDSGFSSLRSVLSAYKTNLSLGDKIAIALFSRSVDSLRRTNIDLRETNVIKEGELQDGSHGYLISGLSSLKLRSYFSDYYLNQKPTRIVINNNSVDRSIGENVGEIVEIMGGKVVSITSTGEEADYICKIGPKDDKRAISISAVLGCELVSLNGKIDYDIQINMGKNYTLIH